MSPRTRRQVRDHAGGRCEYCRFHEADLPLWPFHLDHVIAGQHAGTHDPANLAWTCQRCNLFKGTNLSAVDPDSTQVVRLFDPRAHRWAEHFRIERDRIVGLTPTGRATVWLLQMNTSERMELRVELAALGRWPPPTR
jgi:hypothetical protein